MFSSRAEHRLLFNHPSAEIRLFSHASKLEIVGEQRLKNIKEKIEKVLDWSERLEKQRFKGEPYALHLRRSRSESDLPKALKAESKGVRDEVFYRVVYRGYLEREMKQVEKLKHIDKIRIPAGFEFAAVKGLRAESAQKLAEIAPHTLGQASRISGVNPADISVLMVYLASK